MQEKLFCKKSALLQKVAFGRANTIRTYLYKCNEAAWDGPVRRLVQMQQKRRRLSAFFESFTD